MFLFDGAYLHFQPFFSYIMAVSFIGGGNHRKPPTSSAEREQSLSV
jgi:hypothetical protein